MKNPLSPNTGPHNSPRAMPFLILLALAISWAYVLATPWHLRGYDAGGHIQYMMYILRYWSAPNPYGGWEFYHPPLYYFLSAVLWNILASCGVNLPGIFKALQFQSLAYISGFVIFSVMTFDLTIKNHCNTWGGKVLLTGLLFLWPSLVINAARIGNDSLLYFLAAAAFYFIIKWWLNDLILYFWLAGVFAALAALTKSNGMIYFFLIGTLFLLRRHTAGSKDWRIILQKTWPVLILFIAVSLYNKYPQAVFNTLSGKQPNPVCSNAAILPDTLKVDNTLKAYIGFDARTYWEQPFTSAWDDSKGRNFFWNYLLKTSLFGEFALSDNKFAAILAKGLSCGLLVIIFFPAAGFWVKRSEWPQQPCDLPMSITALLFLGSLILFHFSAPFACSGDFRYIFPVLLPLLYFYCTAIEKYQTIGWNTAARLGVAAGWGFFMLSAAFAMALIF